MKKVIYHANCADGFCSAWILSREKEYEGAEFIPMQYGKQAESLNVEDFRDDDLVIVDFSFKRPVMGQLHTVCKSLICLDHHKSAEEELKGLPYCTFEKEQSGAMMTFNLLSTGYDYSMAHIVEYVQDRDLWMWKLPYSREVSAAIASYPQDFGVWDSFRINDLTIGGGHILRYQQQQIDRAIGQAAKVKILGYTVPIINTTTLISELVGALAEGNPFAVGFFIMDTATVVMSFRSDENGVDVSEIAKRFGGGGHKNAAGCSMNYERFREIIS